MATRYVNIAEMVVFSRMYFQLYECISDFMNAFQILSLVKDNISSVSNSA